MLSCAGGEARTPAAPSPSRSLMQAFPSLRPSPPSAAPDPENRPSPLRCQACRALPFPRKSARPACRGRSSSRHFQTCRRLTPGKQESERLIEPGAPRLLVVRRARNHLALPVAQIGRATCRERGCQYGEIAVVAVSLKKKQKIKRQ